MIQKLKLAAGVSMAALVLAACGNTIPPLDPFPSEEKIAVSASTDSSDPVRSGVSLAAGETVLFEVTIPPQVLEMDYVWFEVSTDAGISDVQLYDSIAGTPNVAVMSTETGWFDTIAGHNGDAPPEFAAAGLAPADIDLGMTCTGPCIGYATDNNIGTTRYLRVNADADTSFDLYVWGGTLDEEIGLVRTDAQQLQPGESVASAIIWSGMEQWYHVTEEASSVTLTHVTPEFAGMAFKANIYLDGNLVETEAVLSAENPTYDFPEATSGFFIKVYSYNESRAAQAGNARYNISVDGLISIPLDNN